MTTFIIILVLITAIISLAITCLSIKANYEDLKNAFDELNALYEKETGEKIDRLKKNIINDDKDEILLETRRWL